MACLCILAVMMFPRLLNLEFDDKLRNRLAFRWDFLRFGVRKILEMSCNSLLKQSALLKACPPLASPMVLPSTIKLLQPHPIWRKRLDMNQPKAQTGTGGTNYEPNPCGCQTSIGKTLVPAATGWTKPRQLVDSVVWGCKAEFVGN
jgi:hypothetical protein